MTHSASNSASNSATKPSFCFLAGTGRSGTTVLRNSLGKHPDVYYNGKENNIVQDVIDVARYNFVAPSRQFALVVSKVEYCVAFRELLTRIIWPDENLRRRRIWMAAINPSAETLEFLFEVFPNARVVGLIRDGVDVVLSRQNHRAFKTSTFESHCRTWIRSGPVIEWGKNQPDRFRLFEYKWFDDRAALTAAFDRIFEWINISASSAPVEHAFERTYHPTQAAGDTKTSPAMSREEKRDQWRQWTDEQRQMFKSICGPLMDQMGFEVPF